MCYITASYNIIPYSKQLHLTLAYNFEAEHRRILEEQAVQHINFRAKSDWEIRLYSRDSRADSKLVNTNWNDCEKRNIKKYRVKIESDLETTTKKRVDKISLRQNIFFRFVCVLVVVVVVVVCRCCCCACCKSYSAAAVVDDCRQNMLIDFCQTNRM